METAATRREFAGAAIAAAAMAACGVTSAAVAAPAPAPTPAPAPQTPLPGPGIRVLFLGSGAAGWNPASLVKHPHGRRQSSILLDDRVLIDFTACSFDKLPPGCRPEALFQTHSHGDHYNPAAAVKCGAKRMYVHSSWAAVARRETAEAAAALRLPAPQVVALEFARPVEECGLRFTFVPSNHSTSRVTDGVLERTGMYLVEKGASRLLYATDTSGIPGDAARMIGIDPHISADGFRRLGARRAPYLHRPEPITALVMEATDGDLDDDFRMFVHSSVQTVARTAAMLKRNGRLKLPEGQCVWITHLAIKYRNLPSATVDGMLPPGIRAACDGLELTLG